MKLLAQYFFFTHGNLFVFNKDMCQNIVHPYTALWGSLRNFIEIQTQSWWLQGMLLHKCQGHPGPLNVKDMPEAFEEKWDLHFCHWLKRNRAGSWWSKSRMAADSFSSRIHSDGNRAKNCMGSLVYTRRASARETRHIIALYNFLRDGEEGAELFFLLFSERTCGSGSRLPQGRFKPDIRKHLFTDRVVKHWIRLPREMVNAPSLPVFEASGQCP